MQLSGQTFSLSCNHIWKAERSIPKWFSRSVRSLEIGSWISITWVITPVFKNVPSGSREFSVFSLIIPTSKKIMVSKYLIKVQSSEIRTVPRAVDLLSKTGVSNYSPFELPVTERLIFFDGKDKSSATQAMASLSRSLSRFTGNGPWDLYKLYCWNIK